jgi:hypothetical protein
MRRLYRKASCHLFAIFLPGIAIAGARDAPVAGFE